MTTTIVVIIAALAGLYFFYRRAKARAARTENRFEQDFSKIPPVKAETYIVCPNCGQHMVIEAGKDNE